VVLNLFWMAITELESDSQPGCRGKLGFCKEVSGVPPNLKLLSFN
jgi:hypothetical protein